MYACLICKDEIFNTHQSLHKHLFKHKKDICSKCDEILPTRSARRRHLRHHHALITCVKCNTVMEKLNQAEHSKHHAYLYSVDQLNGIVDIVNQIQQPHQGDAANSTPNIIKYNGTRPNCPVKNCDKQFSNANDLINHFIEHRTNHICTNCREIFANDEKYRTHCANNTCRLYRCHTCGKDFRFGAFVRHIATECNIETPKLYRIFEQIQYSVVCFVCGAQFPDVGLLSTHLKMHNKTLNVCAKCFCVFGNGAQLRNHVTAGCQNCQSDDLPVNIRAKLMEDIRVFRENTVESPVYLESNKKVCGTFDERFLFQCNVCDSKFVKFSYLQEHCAKFSHELIVCYRCLCLFNTWDDYRKHRCDNMDFNLPNAMFSELEFRELFNKCVKRKCETQIQHWDSINNNNNSNNMNKDITRRMSLLIRQLEDTKFPNENVTKILTTPTTPVVKPISNVKTSNDDYDLNKILPRIMERRNKRLLSKRDLGLDPDLGFESDPGFEPDPDDELEKIGNNLQDLDICKKHLIVENDENLSRMIKRRNKRHVEETIEDIDRFLAEWDPEIAEPPLKRNKSFNDDMEDTFE